MKRARWAAWILPAFLFLPSTLAGQQHEQSVTTTLLSGKIVYAGGDLPAEQVNVELWAATGTPVATTITGWSGEFVFAELAPGEYLISADKPGCEPLWERVQVSPGGKRFTLQLKRNDLAGNSVISARDLSIPPKARMALRDGISLLRTDLPRAMASLERAIASFPDYYEAHYVIGMANLMMERLPDAETAFRHSIELSEYRYARPLLALGAILCDQEKFDEAELVIRDGLALDDTPWIGHLLLARALLVLGDWDEAEERAKTAILRRPDISDAYLLLAHIHARQNNATAVLEDLDHFLRLQPDGEISAQARKARQQLSRPDLSGKVDPSI